MRFQASAAATEEVAAGELGRSLLPLPQALRHWAQSTPSKVAFRFLSRDAVVEQLSFGELHRRARAVAGALAERTRPGDRVLLIYPPGLEMIAAFLGCLEAGVIAVPAKPPHLRRAATTAGAIYRDARPSLVLTDDRTRKRLLGAGDRLPGQAKWLATDQLAVQLDSAGRPGGPKVAFDPESIAFLQYTSGSTSSPRGVVVKHRHLEQNFRQMIAGFGLDADWFRPVSWGPLYHDMGLIAHTLLPICLGVTTTLMAPFEFLQSPASWLRAIMDYQGTFSVAPNFAYELCVDRVSASTRQSLDLSGWRVAGNGSEPVRWRTIQRFSEAFEASGFRRECIFPCYGLAEATLYVSGGPAAKPMATATHKDLGTRVASGKPDREGQVLIVDPDTREAVPIGQVGEIWVHQGSVAAGYWQRPEESADTFGATSPAAPGKAFLRTGDLGSVDAQGYLFVTGRLKELIILHGRNLYPQDLEAEAAQADPSFVPDGAAAFSVDIDDEERLVVVQEIRRRHLRTFEPKQALAALRRSLSANLDVGLYAAVFIRPRTLPRTSSGKIRRLACKQDYLASRLEEVRSHA